MLTEGFNGLPGYAFSGSWQGQTTTDTIGQEAHLQNWQTRNYML